MRNWYFKTLMVFVLAVGLIGCGGGGGESDDDSSNGSGSDSITPSVPVTDLDPEDIPVDRQDEWDDYVEETENTSIAQIIGLYDVTRVEDGKTDVGFFSIQENEDGQLIANAYNYMQDDFSNEGACYRMASNDDINAIFNKDGGTVLNWVEPWKSSDNTSYYSVLLGEKGVQVKWLMDEYRNVTALEYMGMSAGLSVRVRSGEVNAYLVKEKMYRGTDKLAEIKSRMCQGDLITDSDNLQKNFSGLYNTFTTDQTGYVYESYLNISEDGLIETFKYMGDGYDPLSNMNCYVTSYAYNAGLESKRLTYDAENNRLFTDAFGDKFFWNLDENGNVISVNLNDDEPASTAVNHQNFISLSSLKETSITKEDIESMICQ